MTDKLTAAKQELAPWELAPWELAPWELAPWELERCAKEGITPERYREIRNATISRLAKELAAKRR